VGYVQRVCAAAGAVVVAGGSTTPWQLLLVVGVGTPCRRAGRGTQLLRCQLDELDGAGVPAFAFDEATRALLGSVGFMWIGGARLPSGNSCSLLRSRRGRLVTPLTLGVPAGGARLGFRLRSGAV